MIPAEPPTAASLVAAYADRGWTIATAESCTGGLVAAALTEVPGSSAVFERGFVTYSNRAKSEMLGVPPDLINDRGAVSREVALAMAAGALRTAGVDVAVAITGIAGPGGGSAEKPIGLVHLAVTTRAGRINHLEGRYGDLGRAAIRERAVADALDLLRQALDG